jgi:hypothetical protein
MKRIIVIIICCIAAWVLIFSVSRNRISYGNDLLMENITAITMVERPHESIICYRYVTGTGTGLITHITYCGDCKPILCTSWDHDYTCYAD